MTIFKTAKQVAGFCKAKFNLDSSSFGTTMAFMLLALVALSPDSSWAATASGLNAVICNIVHELQGPVARGVAAFGIIFLGFSLFLGKISWGVALALGIGIAAIFGANEIVTVMVGGTGDCTDDTVVVVH
jgi:type IV secretory pathway VirB2 component (pilin)